jgi:hypothetical protein
LVGAMILTVLTEEEQVHSFDLDPQFLVIASVKGLIVMV